MSGPAVAAAVGLRQALLPDEAADKRHDGVLENSDDISTITTAFGALATGEVPRLNLFEVVHDALLKAESLPQHRTEVRVYAVDAVDEILVGQGVDPTTGVRESGTLVSADVALDGCDEPMDVEIHPLGDVVYVLCGDSAQIAAYTATDLDYVGSVGLDGVVGGSAELVMLPSGVLYVATRNDADEMVVEAFDTWTGAREAPTALLWDTFSTSTPVGAGGAAHPEGTSIGLMVSDYISTSEDYDVMVKITPDHDGVDKGTSVSGGDTTYDATDVESLMSVANTRNARDLDWLPDGSAALGVFNRASGGGYAEIVQTDFDGTATSHTVSDDCEYPVSIAVDHSGQTNYGFVACTVPTGSSDRKLAVIDLSTTPSAFSPVTSIFANLIGGTDLVENVGVDVADNGRFVVVEHEPISTSFGYVRTISMDSVEAAVSASEDLDSSDLSALSHAFDTPAGTAITPTVSIANPRPGTLLRGARRLHVVLREPGVSQIEIFVDGTSVCTDSKVSRGSSSGCMLDASGWSAGTHLVTVEVTGADSAVYAKTVPYEAE